MIYCIYKLYIHTTLIHVLCIINQPILKVLLLIKVSTYVMMSKYYNIESTGLKCFTTVEAHNKISAYGP